MTGTLEPTLNMGRIERKTTCFYFSSGLVGSNSYLHGWTIIALLCLFLKNESGSFFLSVSHENDVG